MIYRCFKYILFFFIFCFFFTQISYAGVLPLLNDKLNQKGFIKKQPFEIRVGYEYSFNDGFNLLSSDITGNASNITDTKIKKSSNGVKTEAGVYITPFLKIFINYTYRDSRQNINGKIEQKSNIFLTKDYSYEFAKKSNEHIYMAGFEADYEWTVKKYTPYISLKAGFGATATDSYDDTFYNASFTLKAGSYITFNKNFRLNVFVGADYTTLFNNGAMVDNFDVTIPAEYLLTGIPAQHISISMEYAENYDKNINMMLGAEFDIYKYASVFAEVKFINSLTAYTGVKVMF